MFSSGMPEQLPFRRHPEFDPLPYAVDAWDEQGNMTRRLGKTADLSLGLALYWAAVARERNATRLTLRNGARVIEKTDDDR
jgi:hypothetical protein